MKKKSNTGCIKIKIPASCPSNLFYFIIDHNNKKRY